VTIVQAVLPVPASAWWGKLEKLSGPGDFKGLVVDFRLACFGDVSPKVAVAQSLAREAAALTLTALGADKDSATAAWSAADARWQSAAKAWAEALGRAEAPQPMGTTPQERSTNWPTAIAPLENENRVRSMATSAAGVDFTLCGSNKERRFAVDLSWHNLSTAGSTSYTGSRVNLDMLIASLSLRVFPSTRFDVLDVGAGAGPYWFTSAPPEGASAQPNPDGIPALNGVVIQPIRLTFHVPSHLSTLKGWKYLTIPSVSWGLTRFPNGFEPGDFGAGESAARRFPAEWLTTWYVSANVQPLLQKLVR
jgi:hypothetical protein